MASRGRGCTPVRLGAQVIVPRIEVPNVGNIALVADPTGASVGLFEPHFTG